MTPLIAAPVGVALRGLLLMGFIESPVIVDIDFKRGMNCYDQF